jgi:antirestriction protein ArdC
MAFLIKALRYVTLNYALLLTSNLRRAVSGSVLCRADKFIKKISKRTGRTAGDEKAKLYVEGAQISIIYGRFNYRHF